MSTLSHMPDVSKRHMALSFLIQIVLGCVIAFHLTYKENHSSYQTLNKLNTRIRESIVHDRTGWSLSRYIADPLTPHPSGSGGFSDTLYIIMSDGFVIERNLPLAGFLDSGQYQYLHEFQTPQTVEPMPRETWRIQSKKATYGSNEVMIGVAVYHPERFVSEVVNAKLTSALDYITRQVSLRDHGVLLPPIDMRQIDYDVSFEIVSSENKTIVNNGRMPSYIEKSRFFDELHTPQQRTIVDATNHTSYLVLRTEIPNSDGSVGAIILSAKPALTIKTVIRAYWLEIAAYIGIQSLLYAGTAYFIRRKFAPRQVSTISFDVARGLLLIDDRQIMIPTDTIQFKLCKRLLLPPFQAHTGTQLLDEGDGDLQKDWRKVYDAVVLLNRKIEHLLPTKLIEVHHRHFSLSTSYRALIK